MQATIGSELATADRLINEVRARGVQLSLDGEHVVARPASKLDAATRVALKENRDAIISLLAGKPIFAADTKTPLRAARVVSARQVARDPRSAAGTRFLCQRGALAGLPCPSDLAERAAIIEEGDRVTRAEAEARALSEAGFESWDSYLHQLAQSVREAVQPYVHHSLHHVRLLVKSTELFLRSPHFAKAVELGFSLSELFGVHPRAPLTRVGAQGIVPGVALSVLKLRLVSLDATRAEFASRTGAQLVSWRGGSEMNESRPWWDCSTLIADGATLH